MTIKFLERTGKPKLAYRKLEADSSARGKPCVMFCGGFRSDMEGTKAVFLEELCRESGQSYVRFDYSGHGSSGGDFADGTIGSWLDDTLAVMDEITEEPVILVGSSMGGWLALLAALARPERVAGLVGIAAAPDFTREIYHEQLDDEHRALLETQGYIEVPSDYSPEPYRITRDLLEEGNTHCLLDRTLDIGVPLRLLQGMQDTDVPWQKAHRIRNAIKDPEQAVVVLIETGDHRLSRPEDLELLGQHVRELSA